MFKTFGLKNIKIFYLLAIFLNGWFISSNFLFFMERKISLEQIAIVEAIGVLIGIMMEVPSGLIADIIGKKKAIAAGGLFGLIGCLLIIQANSLYSFIIAQVLIFSGMAFYSGSVEAFGFDSLLEKDFAEKYDEVISSYTFLATIMTIISVSLGSLLYSIHPNMPWIAWGVFQGIVSILMIIATEPKIDSETYDLKKSFHSLKQGMQQLFQRRLQQYLIPIVGITIMTVLTRNLFEQAFGVYLGFDGNNLGYVLGGSLLIASPFGLMVPKIRERLKDRTIFSLSLIVYAVSFLIAFFNKSILSGILIYLLLSIITQIIQPLISITINSRVDSKYRSTTLSTLAFIGQIPYIIFLFFFPFLFEQKFIPKLLIIYITTYFLLFLSFQVISIAKPKKDDLS
jgi:MFS family permease